MLQDARAARWPATHSHLVLTYKPFLGPPAIFFPLLAPFLSQNPSDKPAGRRGRRRRGQEAPLLQRATHDVTAAAHDTFAGLVCAGTDERLETRDVTSSGNIT